MDSQELVTGVRWELLQRIASQPASGSDLALFLGTSAANVSQHLKLLELAGLVAKERVNGRTVHYRLNQEVALVTLLADPPLRATVPLGGLEELEIRLLAHPSPYSKALRRFLLQHEELVTGFLCFGVVKELAGEVQLLVIAEDVKPLRKEYANIQLGNTKIVIWSHTPLEIDEGLKQHEHYFTELISNLLVLHDPAGQMQRWKEVLQ